MSQQVMRSAPMINGRNTVVKFHFAPPPVTHDAMHMARAWICLAIVLPSLFIRFVLIVFRYFAM
jgi:hypothetical protein